MTFNIASFNEGSFNLLDSAIILALFTALLYYVNWCFTQSYFARLGINSISIPLDSSFSNSMPAIVVIVGIIVLFYFTLTFRKSEEVNRSRFFVAISNIFLLIVSVLSFGLAIVKFQVIIQFFAGILFLSLFLVLIYCKEGMPSIWGNNLKGKLFVILVLIAAVTYSASLIGIIQATRTIQGEFEGSTIIDFNLSNPNLTELNGQELILIAHDDEKYYVTPLETNLSQTPTIYIVPDSEVELATMRRIS